MKVLTYPPIIDSYSMLMLRGEVESFLPLDRTYWLGMWDEPDNVIEKYIQDSFDFFLTDKTDIFIKSNPWNILGAPIGFEWWIQDISNHNTITFHCNYDNSYRDEYHGVMRYPLVSTKTYLTNNSTPTIILDTQQGDYWEQFNDFPPSEITFSVPEEGKFEITDPRYIRGVFHSDPNRLALCYDIWQYKPERLNRVGIHTNGFDCRFYKNLAHAPKSWLGKLRYGSMNLSNKQFNIKYPHQFNLGETWKVTQ
tara:strand:+ start:204 stop:959 length:756 start_codon:yes stop_codon:yes gene_type:complete